MPDSRRAIRLLLCTALLLSACTAPEREAADAGDASASASPSAAGMELAGSNLPNPFRTMIRPWGQLPGDREWGQVSAVATDVDGQHLWIADRCGASSCVGSTLAPVLKIDPAGSVVQAFGEELFIRPHGVFVDSEGHVWVTDHLSARAEQLETSPSAAGKGHQVFKFSPEGEILFALGMAGEAGDPPERLNNPTAVIVAEDGSIFVSEGHSNQSPPGRITKFAPDGTFLLSWGQFGEGEGEFRTPHGMAFDSQGRLFVADRGNNRVQIFDQNGAFLDAWHQFGRPNDVLIDRDDTMYVIDSESSDEANPGFLRGIYIGSARTGEVTGLIPAHPTANPFGTHGEGVALDAEGNLFVAEVSIRGMTRYSP